VLDLWVHATCRGEIRYPEELAEALETMPKHLEAAFIVGVEGLAEVVE
jgi:hypothetical protein